MLLNWARQIFSTSFLINLIEASGDQPVLASQFEKGQLNELAKIKKAFNIQGFYN